LREFLFYVGIAVLPRFWARKRLKNMPILCGIYQILALSAEYKLYFNNKQEGNIVKNHVLSSKSVIFYTFFFDKV